MPKKKTELELFAPVKGWVLVRPLPEITKTKGGVLIPDTAQEKPQKGTVIRAHAEGIHAQGTLVLYGRYAGTHIKLDEEIMLLLKEFSVTRPGDADGDIVGTLGA